MEKKRIEYLLNRYDFRKKEVPNQGAEGPSFQEAVHALVECLDELNTSTPAAEEDVVILDPGLDRLIVRPGFVETLKSLAQHLVGADVAEFHAGKAWASEAGEGTEGENGPPGSIYFYRTSEFSQQPTQDS